MDCFSNPQTFVLVTMYATHARLLKYKNTYIFSTRRSGYYDFLQAA